MGHLLSVTLAEIHMIRMENDVILLKPIFYRRNVDDIINCHKKNVPDELFFKLNYYHQNIKLTIEICPTKFLDTQLVYLNGKVQTKVYRKPNKLPVPWSSNIPNLTREMQLMVTYIMQSKLQQIVKRTLYKLKRNS